MTFLLLTKQWMQHGRENCLGRRLSCPKVFSCQFIAGSVGCLLILPKPDIFCYFLNVDSSLATTTKASNRSLDQIIPALMAFVIAIVTLLRSVKDVATKRLPDKNESDEQSSAVYQDCIPKEEFRPPSPGPGFAESDLFSLVLQRLAELEAKVHALEEKPSEMPCEKEELLNAAVRRVDALEAELIVTKKVIP